MFHKTIGKARLRRCLTLNSGVVGLVNEKTFQELFPSLTDEHRVISVLNDSNPDFLMTVKIYEQHNLIEHCYDKQVLQVHIHRWMKLLKNNDPSLARDMFEVYQECEWQEEDLDGL